MTNTIRAAAVQMDVYIGENNRNLQRVLERLEDAAKNGAQLVVFPECALSGYCFNSLDEATKFADVFGPQPFGEFQRVCMRYDVMGVIGFLQYRKSNEAIYNAAWYSARGGPRQSGDRELDIEEKGVYWKTHLPTLGVDRFVSPGHKLFVHDGHLARVGILICYDIRFPEAARVLGLQGADIIALPTNWPEGAESSPDFITRTRAWENRVYVVAANRVGVERGRRFIGRSQIVSPNGEILIEAGPEEETIIYADLDLNLARQKRIVIEPGEWELDITGDRRPDLYGELVKGG